MLRIALSALFTAGVMSSMSVLAPEGNWLYLAMLCVSTSGFTALVFLSKE